MGIVKLLKLYRRDIADRMSLGLFSDLKESKASTRMQMFNKVIV